jgi:Helix-turn-helix domain of resolvase
VNCTGSLSGSTTALSPIDGLGEPTFARRRMGSKQYESAQGMLGKSTCVGEVARTTGLTRQTVYRIKDDPAGAEAALATWGL